MTQIALPVSDDFTGGWTPTPVFEQVSGGQVVQSSIDPQGDAFEVKLKGLAWPGPGPETLTVQLAGDGSTLATVVLLQGTQIIAAKTITPSGSFSECVIELTDAQKALITNYQALHVGVIAGGVTVDGCPDDPL